MRTFEEYMKMPYKLEIIPDTEESGFVASYPELPGCITCGETIADAVANAEDAKKEWPLAAIEDNIEIAEPENAESYSGQFKLRLPKTLHKTLAEDFKEGRRKHEPILCLSAFKEFRKRANCINKANCSCINF